MRIRVGFVGDCHVGRAERWTTEAAAIELHRVALVQQLRWCRDQSCSHVVVLGDVFDTPSPSQEQQRMVLRVLAAQGWASGIVVMSGNHDVRDAGTNGLRLLSSIPEAGALDNVEFVLAPRVVRFDRVRVLVVPWGHRVPDLRTPADLCTFHDAVVGARHDNGRPSTRGLGGIADQPCPCVGGHLHTPQRSSGVVFAGTAAQMSFGERPAKRNWHVTIRVGEDAEFYSEPVRDPAWVLERVRYDHDDPPACDDPKTFYSLDVGGERPGPRWLVDHPRVVTMHGGDQTRLRKAANTVVSLMSGSTASGDDDRDLLRRWLRHHSNLDEVGRAHALRLHDKIEQRVGSTR